MNFTNGTTTVAIEANTVKEALEEAIRMNITEYDDYEDLYDAVESFNGLPIDAIESVFEDLEVSDDDTIEVDAELNSANTISRDSSICHVSLDAPGGFATKDCIVKLGTTLMDLLKENQRFLNVAINEISNLETFVNDTIARAEYALKDGDHVSTSVRAAGTKGYHPCSFDEDEDKDELRLVVADASGNHLRTETIHHSLRNTWVDALSQACTVSTTAFIIENKAGSYVLCNSVDELIDVFHANYDPAVRSLTVRVIATGKKDTSIPVGKKYINLIVEDTDGEIRSNSGMVRINHLREDLTLFTKDCDDGHYKNLLLVKNNGLFKLFSNVDDLYKFIEEHPEEAVDSEGSVHVRGVINNKENEEDGEEHNSGCGHCTGCCEDICEDCDKDDAEGSERAVGDDTFCIVKLPGGFEQIEVEVKHQETTLEEVVTSTRILRLTGMNPEQARTLKYLVNEVPVEDLDYKISEDDVITMCARTAGVKG